MKHLKKSFTLLMLLTVIVASQTFAQEFLNGNLLLQLDSSRTREVLQDNEYTYTGFETGNFYDNPLMLNGKTLEYHAFNLDLKGELTVIKGAPISAKTIQVPFFVYLRRDGKRVSIPGNEGCNVSRTKIEISQILQYAEPGDQLVIEPINKEDGPAKRILKLRGGC